MLSRSSLLALFLSGARSALVYSKFDLPPLGADLPSYILREVELRIGSMVYVLGVQEGAVVAWMDPGIVMESGDLWASSGSSSPNALIIEGYLLGLASTG
jgi:hypothetical protein